MTHPLPSRRAGRWGTGRPTAGISERKAGAAGSGRGRAAGHLDGFPAGDWLPDYHFHPGRMRRERCRSGERGTMPSAQPTPEPAEIAITPWSPMDRGRLDRDLCWIRGRLRRFTVSSSPCRGAACFGGRRRRSCWPIRTGPAGGVPRDWPPMSTSCVTEIRRAAQTGDRRPSTGWRPVAAFPWTLACDFRLMAESARSNRASPVTRLYRRWWYLYLAAIIGLACALKSPPSTS